MRIILDTSVLVSAVINQKSVPAQAIRAALATHVLLSGSELLAEWKETIGRQKFDRYVAPEVRTSFLEALVAASDRIDVRTVVRVCGDPNDDHLFALALDGRAEAIVTGDRKVLDLDGWNGVRIQTPGDFVKRA